MGGVGGGHAHIEINNPLPTYTQLPTYPGTKTPLPYTTGTLCPHTCICTGTIPMAERHVCGVGRNKRETRFRGDKLEGELDCTKCLIHTHAHTQHISTYMHHTHPHYTSYTQAHPYTHATHIPTLMYHTRMQHTPQQVNTHISHLYSCIKHMHHTPTHCCAPHTTMQHTYTYHNYTRVPVPHTAGWVTWGEAEAVFRSSFPPILQ